MFEYPLIRFDDKKWLEELQQGKLFLRNALYYQYLESKDAARSDVYDGSIPAQLSKVVIDGKELSNGRFMNIKAFIKSFTCCDESDFIVGSKDDRYRLLSLSNETKAAIQGFNTNSALIIMSPSRFIEQIHNAAIKNNESAICQRVEYLSDSELQKKEESIFLEKGKEDMRNRFFEAVPFLKRQQFQKQKEFRVCISHEIEGFDYNVPIQYFEKRLCDATYTLDLGEPVDAFMVPIKTILTDGVIYDTQRDMYLIREDGF